MSDSRDRFAGLPDPYAAPTAIVADAPADAAPGLYVENGQSRPAGAGWRWIAEGWRLFRLQPGMWIAVSLLLVVVYSVASVLPVVGGIAALVLTPPLFAGVLRGCRELEGGGELQIAHVFAGFRGRVGPLYVLGGLYVAAIVVLLVAVFLVAGSAFLALFTGGARPTDAAAGATVVLGILVAAGLSVPIAMAFWMATPLVLFHEVAPLAALRSSFVGCLRNWLPFLVYGLALAVLAVPATITLLAGWLLLLPVTIASYYASYRDLFTRPA